MASLLTDQQAASLELTVVWLVKYISVEREEGGGETLLTRCGDRVLTAAVRTQYRPGQPASLPAGSCEAALSVRRGGSGGSSRQLFKYRSNTHTANYHLKTTEVQDTGPSESKSVFS